MRVALLSTVLGVAVLLGCRGGSDEPPACGGAPCASALAMGNGHGCALMSGGAVECWGSNTFGELGNGGAADSLVPVSVSNLAGAAAIRAGGARTCALAGGGFVECWGDNDGGLLGTVSTAATLRVPTQVSNLSGVIGLALGSGHACAILSGGSVECWGYNGDGELGDGTTVDRTAPVTPSTPITASALAGGYGHTCAVVANGAVKCWGWNISGQLGNAGVPTGAADSRSTVPVDVSGLAGAVAVTAGSEHTCALSSAGSVACWGSNVWGQLGSNVFGQSVAPLTVDLTGAKAVAITTGDYHSCALLSGGTVKCWGYNADGQLGNAGTTQSNVPVDVSGLAGATAVSAGAWHTCALLGSGRVKCWGQNRSGELGDGTTIDRHVPVDVAF
jgi:alpha-tubulin suppressor-like RCC1 family protein